MENIPFHPYQLRIDIVPQPDEQISQELEIKYLDLFSKFQTWTDIQITNYILGFEISETGKPHMQCIVWFKSIIPSNKLSKYRNWWKKYSAETYQPVSLTKSIKPEHLAMYCSKSAQTFSNIAPDILEQLPKWKSNKEEIYKIKQMKKQEQLLKLIKTCLRENPIPEPTEPGLLNPDNNYYKCCECESMYYLEPWFKKHLRLFSVVYWEIYQSPMRRHTGLKLLLQLKIMTHKTYIKCIYKNLF